MACRTVRAPARGDVLIAPSRRWLHGNDLSVAVAGFESCPRRSERAESDRWLTPRRMLPCLAEGPACGRIVGDRSLARALQGSRALDEHKVNGVRLPSKDWGDAVVMTARAADGQPVQAAAGASVGILLLVQSKVVPRHPNVRAVHQPDAVCLGEPKAFDDDPRRGADVELRLADEGGPTGDCAPHEIGRLVPAPRISKTPILALAARCRRRRAVASASRGRGAATAHRPTARVVFAVRLRRCGGDAVTRARAPPIICRHAPLTLESPCGLLMMCWRRRRVRGAAAAGSRRPRDPRREDRHARSGVPGCAGSRHSRRPLCRPGRRRSGASADRQSHSHDRWPGSHGDSGTDRHARARADGGEHRGAAAFRGSPVERDAGVDSKAAARVGEGTGFWTPRVLPTAYRNGDPIARGAHGGGAGQPVAVDGATRSWSTPTASRRGHHQREPDPPGGSIVKVPTGNDRSAATRPLWRGSCPRETAYPLIPRARAPEYREAGLHERHQRGARRGTALRELHAVSPTSGDDYPGSRRNCRGHGALHRSARDLWRRRRSPAVGREGRSRRWDPRRTAFMRNPYGHRSAVLYGVADPDYSGFLT